MAARGQNLVAILSRAAGNAEALITAPGGQRARFQQFTAKPAGAPQIFRQPITKNTGIGQFWTSRGQ
jgi:hypothetical protein